ncbi:MAG: heterodisulfide reductase-related iron-sulfur binding cluster, partial [Acidobacteria bacterium]|nr:heterodisulfide reductase-related iron-sulfur binding cluster [Acidobacteriota bacterium]
CNSILIVETDGDETGKSEFELDKILKNTSSGMRFIKAESQYKKERIWAFRKAASPLLNKGKGKLKSVRIIEDGSVPIENIPLYIQGVKEILGEKNIEMVIFGHSGDGNFHINPFLDLKSKEHFDAVPEIIEKTANLLSSLKGSLAGEHGDGRLRAPYLRIIYGELADIFLKIKEILDPENIFNPDVKVSKNPCAVTENFRYSPSYKRATLRNELSDEKWLVEIERCHGCGTCRDFCPTAKASQFDPLSSRGRAHFLQSFLDGTFDEKEIERNIEIFDSCLTCKECLKNCPTTVDISPIASLILRNYSPPLKALKNKFYTGFSSLPYKIPPFLNNFLGGAMDFKIARFFAEKTIDFRKDIKIDLKMNSFAFEPNKKYTFEGSANKEVVLFYGCFGNIYNKDEETLLAVKILQKLGITVIVPPQGCCGVSKISRGLFESAAENVFFTQKNFIEYAEKGINILYTAPSCGLSIIKDHPLYFESPHSKKIADMTVYFSQFLYNFIVENKISLKPFTKSFVYQTPCHSMILEADESDLKLLNLIPEIRFLGKTSSCCGLSGVYGLQKKNAAVSDKLKQELKKELEAVKSDLIITPCGSCKIQVSNLTKTPVFHPLKIFAQTIL